LIAVSGLFLAVPLFVVIPPLIKLTSPGRVFFVQQRLGQGETPFGLLKFRTMHENQDRGCWTVKGDPRITSVGHVLRKFHLDEIPQFLNIIVGDLSVVGPRPYTRAVHDQVCRLDPNFAMRLRFKPGLTGWAQLAGRHPENGLEHHLHLFNSCDRSYLNGPLTIGVYLSIVGRTVKYLLIEAVNRTF